MFGVSSRLSMSLNRERESLKWAVESVFSGFPFLLQPYAIGQSVIPDRSTFSLSMSVCVRETEKMIASFLRTGKR